MSSVSQVLAAAAFLLSCFLSWAAMPLADYVGRRWRMVVHPRLFGRGGAAISCLGGAALALAALPGFGLVITEGLLQEAGAFLGVAFLLLILGLVDDRASHGALPPLFKLVLETLFALLIWFAGLRPALVGIGWADLLLVLFIAVAATNAFNLIDNMDGVAGSTGAATAAGISALAALNGQYIVAVVAGALAGSLVGFLSHNLGSGRIYLGNAGSLFVGFLLGALALELRLPLEPPWSLVAVIAVLAVPATDTTVTILSRLLARRSPFEGGVDHVSHRLVRLGMSTRGAALTHAWASLAAAAAVALCVITDAGEHLWLVIAAFGAVGLGLLGVRIYEPDVSHAGSDADRVDRVRYDLAMEGHAAGGSE